MKYTTNIKGTTRNKILDQVRSEFWQCKDSFEPKRQQIRSDYKLYNDQKRNPTILSDKSLYSISQVNMAASYSEKTSATFTQTDQYDVEKVDTWTKLFKFDSKEMKLNEINLASELDKLITGVSVREFVGWDKDTPIVVDIDPQTWLGDPTGWLTAERFRFHGKQVLETKDFMENNGFQNIDDFTITSNNLESWMWAPWSKTSQNNEQTTNEDIRLRYVLYRYTVIQGEKYQIAVNKEFTSIGRIMKISNLMRTKSGYTPWPISLKYYRPQRGCPFGTCLGDLVRDGQMNKSKLLNLQVAKAVRSSLGGTRFYDKNVIPNRADLANASEDPKLIGLDLTRQGTNPNNVYWEAQFSQLNNDNPTVMSDISYGISYATAVDPMNMGIVSPDIDTATESQQLQNNSNAMLAFSNSVGNIGEHDFVWKRYCMYVVNLKTTKIIRVANILGFNVLKITKQDLDTKTDPDILISSKSEEKAQQNDTVEAVKLLMPFMTPGTYQYRASQRLLGRNLGLDSSAIELIVETTGQEMEATMQLELLNRNIDLDPQGIDALYDDHDAYIAIYKQGLPTAARDKAIILRMKAKIAQERAKAKDTQQAQAQQIQQGAGMQQQNGIRNAASAQMTSSAMQPDSKIASLQSV